MRGIVRQSKYRHVFAEQFKNEFTYSELRPNIPAWDSNCIKANGQFIAVPWSGGGGAMAIIPQAEVGRKGVELPTLNGHSGQVLDFDFNPFNDYILATGSVDCTVKIWGIPEEGLKETIHKPLVSLEKHEKKVGLVQFHPTSSNVLATACVSPTIRFWDIEHGKDNLVINEGHKDFIQSLSFNRDGSQFVTTCKDRKIRIFDPRTNKVAMEAEGHQGMKGSRCTWLGKLDKIFTSGFTKLAERHYMVWDPKNFTKPLKDEQIDVSAGLIMPFYDEDSSILYLAGKGDGNIRYYEIVDEEPYVHFVSEFKSSAPQRGMCTLPKTSCDVMKCEISRLYKLTNTQIIPISMIVPRKAVEFQADIFPDTAAPEPTQTADEFFAGNNAPPKLVSLKPGENNFASTAPKLSAFQPKVDPSAPKPAALPQKTNDPKELLAQNEQLRARVESLEKEKQELLEKLAALQAPASEEASPSE